MKNISEPTHETLNFDISKFRLNPDGDIDQWEKFVRDFEIKKALLGFEKEHFSSGLELGCGSGRHSKQLSHYCKKLIAMEYNEERLFEKNSSKISFTIGDAQDLSCFADKEFDLVFSSNLIEHLPKIDGCISECARVATDDGVIIHMVPNRTWKFFNLALYYPFLIKTVFNRLFSKFKTSETRASVNSDAQLDMNLRPPEKRSFLVKFLPGKPHGISNSHLREFSVWGQQNWINTFEKNGLVVERIVPQPFYTGYEDNFRNLLRFGNHLGWSSCTGYILKKRPRRASHRVI
jgi:SAM-dependent methyltransferase